MASLPPKRKKNRIPDGQIRWKTGPALLGGSPTILGQIPRRLLAAFMFFCTLSEDRFQLLSYTEQAIARFEYLKTLKLGVKHMDIRIAAIAMEFDGTVVTANTADFRDIPGLDIEDWPE